MNKNKNGKKSIFFRNRALQNVKEKTSWTIFEPPARQNQAVLQGVNVAHLSERTFPLSLKRRMDPALNSTYLAT
jgi:hypothetical protein